jgi:hypothetical protein
MSGLPTLLASSVIRGSHLGESHGGLYRIDLERRTVEQTLDWNRTDIDVAGRGGDRGLRGIAFHGERVLLAANAQLLVLDQDFRVLEVHTNRYLAHCHEISVAGGHVFLTATGYDSVLAFDLATRRFAAGWHLGAQDNALTLRAFDPSSSAGPHPGHFFHLNSVAASTSGVCFSGLNTPGLMRMDGSGLHLAAPLPQGTHNAQMLGEGVLYNDTGRDRVVYRRGAHTTEVAVPRFALRDMVHRGRVASDVARPGFARGLCAVGDGMVAGGSSPSTITVYDLRAGIHVQQVNISMDVRNAVHGLAVWPFS